MPNSAFTIEDVPEQDPVAGTQTTIIRDGQTHSFILQLLGDHLNKGQLSHPDSVLYPHGRLLRTPADDLADKWPPNCIFDYTYGQAVARIYEAGTFDPVLKGWNKFEGLDPREGGIDELTDNRKDRKARRKAKRAKRSKERNEFSDKLDLLFFGVHYAVAQKAHNKKMESIDNWRHNVQDDPG